MKRFVLLAALAAVLAVQARAAFLIFPEGESGLEGDTKSAFEAYKRGDTAKAVALFKAEAGRGEKNAQYALATLYQEGKDVEQSFSLSENWYRKAAAQGQTAAQFNLGLMLLQGGKAGEGVEFLRQSADGGLGRAALLLGGMYLQGNEAVPQNLADAHRYIKTAAGLGEAEAYQLLGRMYESGQGVEKSEEEALKNYELAAKRNSVEAALRLAAKYLDGAGVKKDAAKAIEYLKSASDMKSTRAQYVLGQVYETGMGVEKNMSEALTWYKKASEAGDAQAVMRVAAMHADGQGVTKDEKTALDMYKKAADGGYSPAMYAVSVAYDKGRGTATNAVEGLKWLLRSALAGFSVAQRELGMKYRKGEGVSADTVVAMSWFDRGMRSGDPVAALTLADMMLKGEGGLPPNPQGAKGILSQASELGIADAQVALAEMYEKGLDGRPDLIRAYAILMASADVFEPGKKKMEEMGKKMTKEQIDLAKKKYDRLRTKPAPGPKPGETATPGTSPGITPGGDKIAPPPAADGVKK